MSRSGVPGGSGLERSRIWLCVLVILLLGASTGWAQFSAAAEIESDLQSVTVVLPPGAGKMLVIHLDQFQAGMMRNIRVPSGFVGVGNLQVFEGENRTERTDFSGSPMLIIFKNLAKGLKPIKTFGILDKKTKKWAFWGDGTGALEKMGFRGEFNSDGTTGTLTVTQWPSGDPCVCR
jgi:hypothetical protein